MNQIKSLSGVALLALAALAFLPQTASAHPSGEINVLIEDFGYLT